MSRPRSTFAGSDALGLAVATHTGCNTSTPCTSTPDASAGSSRPPENVSEVCTAASDFAAALTDSRQTLIPDVPVEQFDARDQVLMTYDDLIEASQGLAEDQVDAVRTAEDELVRAVEAVPDDVALRRAVASLRDEAANVQAPVSDPQTEATC